MPKTRRKVKTKEKLSRASPRPGRKPSTEAETELDIKERYLDALRRMGFPYHAAKAVNVSPRIVHRWLEEDPAFAATYQDIYEEWEKTRLNDLEAAAYRRALERSDQLMKFLLASLDPKYRDRVEQEMRGKVHVEFEDNLNLEEL